MIEKIKRYPLAIAFAVVILGGMALDLTATHRSYSTLENRALAQRPTATLTNVLDNSFSLSYESYINDQFIFRDQWISLKSVGETALGKVENNGIIYGKEDQLFEKLTTVDQSRLQRNLDSIKTFFDGQTNSQNTLMIVPSAYSILTQLYATPMANIDQNREITTIYDEMNVDYIYLFPALDKAKEEYLYYKTDHHWTTLGAYTAYTVLCENLDLTPVDLGDLEEETVTDFYGTLYSKAKKMGISSDTLTYYNTDVVSVDIDGKAYDDLYNLEALNERDKYATFLHGNNGITTITTTENPEKKGSILIVKDSYANCLVPFLTYNYQEIVVIDLRQYRGKLSEQLANATFDDILVTYSYANLSSDVNIPLINY